MSNDKLKTLRSYMLISKPGKKIKNNMYEDLRTILFSVKQNYISATE